MNPAHSRREMLESLGIGTAGLVLGGYTATARGFAKNEQINIGIIGSGGRAQKHLIPAAKKIPGVNLVAVCDIYDDHLKAGNFIAGGKDSKLFTTKHHEELLARKDIDAVIIASPDHLHVPLTIDACAAGKDVYVEKPLVHNVTEGQSVIDAKNRYKRVVQVGTQQRSMPQFIKARDYIQAGRIGNVRLIEMSWCRNQGAAKRPKFNIKPEQVEWKRFLGQTAPDQPFNAERFRSWRWYWDFGGGILTDLMVHWLDAVYFLLNDLGMPETAITSGQQIAHEWWETPDTIQTVLTYPKKKLQIHFVGTFVNAYEKAGVTLMGESGTIYLDRGRMELRPEPNADYKAEDMILGTQPRGADFSDVPDGELLHIGNWIEAIRERKEPSSPVEPAVQAAAAAHWANLAYRENRVVKIPG